MMMFALISLVRQKEGARKEEEKVGGRREVGSTGTATQGVNAPIGPTRSGVYLYRLLARRELK